MMRRKEGDDFHRRRRLPHALMPCRRDIGRITRLPLLLRAADTSTGVDGAPTPRPFLSRHAALFGALM